MLFKVQSFGKSLRNVIMFRLLQAIILVTGLVAPVGSLAATALGIDYFASDAGLHLLKCWLVDTIKSFQAEATFRMKPTSMAIRHWRKRG